MSSGISLHPPSPISDGTTNLALEALRALELFLCLYQCQVPAA